MSSTSGHPRGCGCCTGVDAVTPRRLGNAPGFPSITYRAGTLDEFYESMRARLSSADHPALAALTTREASDFTLAIADALASSLDVLSFYAERFANEHYLRTATERRSILELAALIGYQLAPGVAASTHLAFTLQGTPGVPVEPITIPVGTRVQSVPGQGERAQTFETVTAVPARAEWNGIAVQTSTPWRPKTGDTELWLAGVATPLQIGDAILLVGAERKSTPGSERWDVRVLSAVETDIKQGRTRVQWSKPLGSQFPPMSPSGVGVEVHVFRKRTALFGHNAPNPNLFGNDDSNLAQLIDRSSTTWFWFGHEISTSSIDLESEQPKVIAGSWVALVSNEPGIGSPDLPGYTELYGVQRVAHLSRSDFALSGKITRVFPDTTENLTPSRYSLQNTLVLAQSERLLPIDVPLFHPVYGDALTLGVRIDSLRPRQAIALFGPRQRIAIAAGATGLALKLDTGEFVALTEADELFLLAPAVRMQGSARDALAAEQFAAQIGDAQVSLELRLEDRDGRAGTLQVKGSQIRLASARKEDRIVSEIVFLKERADAIQLDRDFTHLQIRDSLQHVYERASLRINANVAPATHGESVDTILGSGDGRVADQRFALHQSPLTYVSAATTSGRASALEVRVDDVLWKETPTLYGAAPAARLYVTRQDDAGLTTVQFGDGVEGMRLPSGASNVRARYRKGLGVEGNVGVGKLTTLLSRPLGVSEVTNPSSAGGGEDQEPLERARDNAPLTVQTLDRAVSIEDYQNYARAFAGIDKAHALWVDAGPGRGVFLTVAGVQGARLLPEKLDDLRNSLIDHGDPLVPIRIVDYADSNSNADVRFVCRLSIKVQPDFEYEKVRATIGAALRARFHFAARDFGQPVSVDEVAAVAHGVRGVAAVHVTRLHKVGEPAALIPRLFAALPVPSLTALPAAAELLTLADEQLELEAMS